MFIKSSKRPPPTGHDPLSHRQVFVFVRVDTQRADRVSTPINLVQQSQNNLGSAGTQIPQI